MECMRDAAPPPMDGEEKAGLEGERRCGPPPAPCVAASISVEAGLDITRGPMWDAGYEAARALAADGGFEQLGAQAAAALGFLDGAGMPVPINHPLRATIGAAAYAQGRAYATVLARGGAAGHGAVVAEASRCAGIIALAEGISRAVGSMQVFSTGWGAGPGAAADGWAPDTASMSSCVAKGCGPTSSDWEMR